MTSRRLDEIIGSVTSQMTLRHQPFIAIYTAARSHPVRLLDFYLQSPLAMGIGLVRNLCFGGGTA